MNSLFRKTDSQFILWKLYPSGNEESTIWSPLGTAGRKSLDQKADAPHSEEAVALKVEQRKQDGFLEIATLPTLMIEFAGLQSSDTLKKLQRLKELMHETLGTNGLGTSDQWSSMEYKAWVHCPVLDYDRAKELTVAILSGTEFADYTRIYQK